MVVVEVDVETGLVKILRYVTVEDCGPMINPALVAEQVRGAVVQGIGSTLYEQIVYDGDGQLLTRTLMDYLVPGAAEMPDIEVHHLETPRPSRWGASRGSPRRGRAARPAPIRTPGTTRSHRSAARLRAPRFPPALSRGPAAPGPRPIPL